MKVLLDTNAILDYVLARVPWNNEANAIHEAMQSGRMEGCVTASSITDIFYVARRLIGKVRAREAVPLCLEAFTVIRVARESLEAAMGLAIDDFEDAVQVASAMEYGCDAIVTRDRLDFSNSPIAILSPKTFVGHLTGDAGQDS